MNTVAEGERDVMQVCRNGHVITDRWRGLPETARTRCDRCGAATMHHCATCGVELPGAGHAPGLTPIGRGRPPERCSTCGANFPWARRPPRGGAGPSAQLERLFDRLPLVIRQLRSRHGDRPPFRIEDVRDLEDLVRSLLPLHFDDIRPEVRTPRYSPCTRTDFLLAPHRIALVAKLISPAVRGPEVTTQLEEDREYYSQVQPCKIVTCLVYDPEGLLHERDAQAAAWSGSHMDLEVRCIIASGIATTAFEHPTLVDGEDQG